MTQAGDLFRVTLTSSQLGWGNERYIVYFYLQQIFVYFNFNKPP